MTLNFGFPTLSRAFKTKRRQFGVGSLISSCVIGGVFIAAGMIAIQSATVEANWTRASGQVVEVVSRQGRDSTTYAAVVQYSVNGKVYQTTSSLSSSSVPRVGATKEVAYNPTLPSEAKVVEGMSGTWWLWLVPAVGAVVVCGSLLAFVRSQIRTKKIQHLMQNGLKLQGVMTDLQAVGSSREDNYRIVVSGAGSQGAVQNYVSDVVRGVGSLSLADFRTKPVPIDVYIDPTDPRQYYVDISDIPNLTPDRIQELLQMAAKNARPQTVMGEQPSVSGSSDSKPTNL